MNKKSIVVRVRGRDGNFRIEVQPTDPLYTLKKKIEELTGVPIREQKLSKDQQSEANDYKNDSISLDKYDIKHGDLLFLTYSRDVTSKQDIEYQKQEEKKREIRENEDMTNLDLKGRKKNWTMAEYLALKEQHTVRVKHQDESVLKSVSLDYACADAFQSFLREMAFQAQRMGYMYGTENEEEAAAYVDVIYEPLQESTPEGFIELKDPLQDRADTLASLLGLRKVGWIFSHQPRTGKEYIMTHAEILKTAELQAKHGRYFVSVMVTVNEEGQTQFEAYQVSEQCVKMFQDGLFLPAEKQDSEKPGIIKTKKPVVVDKKETTEVDTMLLITTVAIKDRKGDFLTGFPYHNRPSADYRPSMKACKDALLSRSKLPFLDRVRDFHLLLFLTNYLSLTTDMPALCEAIRTRNADASVGFEMIVNAYCGIG